MSAALLDLKSNGQTRKVRRFSLTRLDRLVSFLSPQKECKMKRYFKCKFVRHDEMYVVVDTEEKDGDLTDRVMVLDELGDAWFGKRQFGKMLFDECEEVSAEEAIDRCDGEPPVAELAPPDDQ
jgi:hypothetical protein